MAAILPTQIVFLPCFTLESCPSNCITLALQEVPIYQSKILYRVTLYNSSTLSEMSCLLSAREDSTVRLPSDCRKMLQDRVTMWEYAAKVGQGHSPRVNYINKKITKKLLSFYFYGGEICL